MRCTSNSDGGDKECMQNFVVEILSRRPLVRLVGGYCYGKY
jgi:hypothetical protein